jgi:hypothetical protein
MRPERGIRKLGAAGTGRRGRMSDERGTRDLVKRSAEVRRAVSETLEQVRRSLATLGADPDRPDAPKAAARPSAPDPDPAAADAPGGLLPDVTATVDRARAVVARTKRVLEETRSHLGGADGEGEPTSSEKPRASTKDDG